MVYETQALLSKSTGAVALCDGRIQLEGLETPKLHGDDPTDSLDRI